MSASSSLEEYIRQFRSNYAKYVPSVSSFDSQSFSSVDTDELLSDTSENSSKRSVKMLSSIKKRKPKLDKPKYMKPLRSTPLKMIQQQEQDGKTPANFNIDEFLPGYREQRNERMQRMLFQIENESDATSMCSSVDTDFLLQSSDQEEPANWNLKKKPIRNLKEGGNRGALKIEELQGPKQRNLQRKLGKQTSEISKTPRLHDLPFSPPKRNLGIEKTNSVAIYKKQLQICTTSIGIKPKISENKTLTICSCIVSGSLFKHFSNCQTLTITGKIQKKGVQSLKKPLKFQDAVIRIQRALRKYFNFKTLSPEKFKESLTYSASHLLGNSSQILVRDQELLGSPFLSPPFIVQQDLSKLSEFDTDEVSDCDTEELLNSSTDSF